MNKKIAEELLFGSQKRFVERQVDGGGRKEFQKI
jgi:hypothetical protein